MDSNPKVFLKDGTPMPLIGLGTLNIKPNDKTFNINDHLMNAAKIGYTHIDINPSAANIQQSIGQALRLIFQVKKQMQDQDGQKIPDQFIHAYPRQNIFISYKVYNSLDIEKNIKTALENLKLQYFDLVMLNCPYSPPPQIVQPVEGQPKQQNEQDKKIKRIPMHQVWKILQNCKQKGLCKTIGLSNFTLQALLNLYPFVKFPPTVNQIQCHPYLIQKNMLQISYCPLLRGGKDQKQPLGDKIDYMTQPILKQISGKYAKTIPQIILNYQICRGVAVIPKTQKLDHLTDNFNITDFQLLEQDIQKLQSLDKGGKIRVYQLKNTPLWKGQDPLV